MKDQLPQLRSKIDAVDRKLVRLLSGGGGVIYKGEGFYVNDYKKKESGRSSD